jgi:hypothetical protein
VNQSSHLAHEVLLLAQFIYNEPFSIDGAIIRRVMLEISGGGTVWKALRTRQLGHPTKRTYPKVQGSFMPKRPASTIVFLLVTALTEGSGSTGT